MKQIKVLKLQKINRPKISQKDLNQLRAGNGFCLEYNCQCHGVTFTAATTKAVLEEDSRR